MVQGQLYELWNHNHIIQMQMTRRKEVERILLDHIKNNGIQFKYLLTCDYFYKQRDYNKVLLDNKHLRRTIRKLYKDNIRMLFFIEKHTDPESNHFGGYHRHILIEDCSKERWLKPSSGMMTLLLNLDPATVFGIKMSKEPPDQEVKEKLLAKAVRDLNQSVPNGYLGTDVRPLTEERGGVTGVIHYLTKQVDQFHPAYEVIDVANSKCPAAPLLNLYREKQDLCGVRTLEYSFC